MGRGVIWVRPPGAVSESEGGIYLLSGFEKWLARLSRTRGTVLYHKLEQPGLTYVVFGTQYRTAHAARLTSKYAPVVGALRLWHS
jgi:hypothetical protein